MRRFTNLLVVAGVLISNPSRAAEDLRSQATADLKRFYGERLSQPFIISDVTPEVKVGAPPWVEPLKRLASGKPKERERAAAYLCELVGQALEDEQSKSAPWRSTPYWGGGAEMPARDLRKEVAQALADARPMPDALPVLRWYLEKERVDAYLEPIVAALGKLDGEYADTLRKQLAVQPHDNVIVAAGALDQLAARKRSLPADRLAILCHHHRMLIRTAARKLNVQQGGKDPGPFDPAKAVRSQPVRKIMEQVLALMPELPPANAELVKVTLLYRDDKKAVKETHTVEGWLIRRERNTLEVYTPYGWLESIRNGERKQVTHYERSPDGKGTIFYDIDITVEASDAPQKVTDVVKEVVASRAKGHAAFDLSEQGPLTGQFRGAGATLYEAILGAWLYRARQDAEAPRILLAALDSLQADRQLVEMVRHRLGEVYGQRMLAAFAGDRDYEQALRHARLIKDKYPDTRFHIYANELADQLPRRKDDFTSLKLPTPKDWAELKKKLTRTEQIDYLCERMRLLHCRPGQVYFMDETQYAEACGMTADATTSLRRGKSEVINPRTELQGKLNDEKRRPSVLLTLKDVPQLSKHLREDWYMLVVGYWRDFHPDRYLSNTRSLFAEIINGLAGTDICKIKEWKKLTPAEIDKEIGRINRWARENAGKSEAQRLLQALEYGLRTGERWYEMQGQAEKLVKKKEKRAVPILLHFLDAKNVDDLNRQEILDCCRQLDCQATQAAATRYLTHKDQGVRLQAAMILFQVGDQGNARAELGRVLESGDEYSMLRTIWMGDAVDLLLKDGSEESRKTALRLFTNAKLKMLDNEHVRASLLRRFTAERLPDSFSFYLPLLDIKGHQLETRGFAKPVAEKFADEITDIFARNDPDVQEIRKKHPNTSDRIPALKKWLQGRAANPRPIPVAEK